MEGDRGWLYETKKRIIERVIYGVDIQGRAIEICKLRLWLSLMVDHDLGVNPFRCERRAYQAALRKLEPLPNLDFKIRRANSLRDTIHGEAVNLFRAGQGVSGELGRSLGRLIDAKHNFYAARKAAQKRRWRLDIYDCLSEMADFHLNQVKNDATGLILDEGDETKVAEVQRINEALTEVRKIRAQIRDARRAKATPQTEALERLQGYFDDEKTPTFVWELDFAEVFFRQPRPMTTGDSLLPAETTATSKEVVKRGGFDLMLGNPPYVRIQTLKKQSPELADYYKRRYLAASKGNYDLYVCFVERGLELLADHGQLAYILPHRFFNAQYGEPLRGLLSRPVNLLRHVVHFGDQQIFPGATNYVCLLFLAKAGAKGGCRFVKAENLKQWLRSLRGTSGTVPAKDIREKEWNFVVGRGADVFERLKAVPTKLGDVAERIAQGPITSADSVYLFKKFRIVERQDTVEVESKELEHGVVLEQGILKRVVRSGDIGRYWAHPDALVLFPYKVVNNQASLYTAGEMERHFRLAWDYLKENRELLEARENGAFQGPDWYGFGRPQNLGMWEQPKLMVPYMITDLSVHLDTVDNFYFINVTTGGYGITTKPGGLNLAYLCALMNSPVLDFFLKRVSTNFHGGYFAANKQFIEQLPIRTLDLHDAAKHGAHEAIVRLVEWMSWLRRQPSVAESTREHPRDPLIAAYFEQWLNAMVYELYFPIELHAASLHFFTLTAQHGLPAVESIPSAQRLSRIREVFETLYDINHPLRAALFGLGSLETIRIIEGRE